MEDFANILQRDYGLKPQGKAAPLAASGSGTAAVNNRAGSSSFDKGKSGSDGAGSTYSSQARAAAHGGGGEEDDPLFRRTNGVSKSVSRSADPSFVFGSSPDKVYRGPTKSSFDDMYGERSSGSSSTSSFGDLLGGFNGHSSRPRMQTSQGSSTDDLLGGFGPTKPRPAWATSDGVYLGRLNDPSERQSQSGLTKHLGEDDLLGSFGDSKPGLQAGDFHGSFEDDFLGGISKSKSASQAGPSYSSVHGDLLEGFGKSEVQKPSMEVKSSPTSPSQSEPVYDDFLPGFGVRAVPEATVFTESTVAPNSSSIDDIFSSPADGDMFAGINSTSGSTVPTSEASAFPDLLDPLSATGPDAGSSRRKSSSRVKSDADGGMYDPFDGYLKPVPVATAKASEPSSTSDTVPDPGGKISHQGLGNEDGRSVRKSFSSSPFVSDSMDSPVLSPMHPARLPKGKHAEVYANDFMSTFGEPINAFEVKRPSSNVGTYWNSDYLSAAKTENSTGEIWLTIEDVKLVTEPSTSPPPSRAPPHPRTEKEQSIPVVMPDVIIEDLGEVVKPSRQARREERKKEQAKEEEQVKARDVGGRDPAFFREPEVEGEMEATQIKGSRREKAAQEKVTEERTTQEAEVRRDIQDRVAKQDEARDREAERLAERAKKAAERVVAEARERAEKAAVERAITEARERAEKAALQRAAAAREQERIKEREQERERKEKEKERERERERKEKEKEREREREKKEKEKERERERREKEKEREKERERDRERDSMRERERGAAEQLRKESANFQATSEPRQRPSVNPPSSGLFRPSSGNFVNNVSAVPLQRQPSGPQKVVDDWTSLFTQPTSSVDEFQETEGEPAERRRIRLEKHQRIEERAAKALVEKNQRDIALQREQEERHRSAANLDAEIRRWSMGKEGNLRALLSSLHLMLWPECNWKPVSLTDLITGPSVKKAYQRAILCVHPDKVQQKGATVQQKYIAEKVFDLLKESFAKFNANELY